MELESKTRAYSENAPLFSVIVLTYLQRHLLNDCLDSIFKQDYPNIELVVCDDCSADFDADEVRAYIEEHRGDSLCNVVVHRNPRTVGTVQTAQTGVELSSGSYFKLLAGNDMLYDQNTLEYAAGRFSSPDVNVLAGRSVACQYDGAMTEHFYPPIEAINCVINADAQTQFNLLGTQARQMYFHAPTIFWRRSFFDKIGGFDCSYQFVGDWPMWLKVTGAGYRITVADKVLATYRYGGHMNSADAADTGFHVLYYRECIRALREYALSRFEQEGRKKKVVRCRHAIRCLENRIVSERDWGSWGIGRQLLWRVKNLDFLLLSWLYRKRYQGMPLPAFKRPLLLMLACMALYAFHVQLLPGLAMDFLWAALFFAVALYLLVRLVLSFGFSAMNVVLNFRGKRG